MGGGNSVGAEEEAQKNCGGLRENSGRTVAGRGRSPEELWRAEE